MSWRRPWRRPRRSRLSRTPHLALDHLGEVGEGLVAEIGAVEDLLAPPVDHLALLVHDLVVLEDVLADLGVAGLDGALRLLDGPGDHLGLNRGWWGGALCITRDVAPGGEQRRRLRAQRRR